MILYHGYNAETKPTVAIIEAVEGYGGLTLAGKATRETSVDAGSHQNST
jgi:hypothetical protein